jgi:hypothetical protein
MLSRIAASLALLLLCSCQLFQLRQPREDWVTAERLTFDAIAGEFAGYVAADLELDEFQRSNRLALLEDWRLRIATAETVLELFTKPSKTGSIPGNGAVE